MININLVKKVRSFLTQSNSLKYLDPNIFEMIDRYKATEEIDYTEYFLEYLGTLPKLSSENVIKISREVYRLYGKENEFDSILERLVNNHNIDNGSLNKDDENCITNASESRILLTGTCYDVVMLCHEIGHKLKYDNENNKDDIMGDVLLETPPVILELAADEYLKNNYNILVGARELRKKHISSRAKDNGIGNSIFMMIIGLLKNKKLDIIHLYNEIVSNKDMLNYLNNHSIMDCFEEGMDNYTYEIGYILGSNAIDSGNIKESLDEYLSYIDNGIRIPFTLDEAIVENTLNNEQIIK